MAEVLATTGTRLRGGQGGGRGRGARGARRRAQLLGALEALLAERPIEQIEIADITGRAGVARSLFYFYFSGKGAAVTALVQDVLAQVAAAGSAWCEGPPETQRDRVTVSVTQAAVLWRRHARLLVALLQAMPGEPAAREQWDDWCADFAARVRERIARDQARGRIPSTVAAGALAETLTGMTLTAMERDVRAVALTGEPLAGVTDALIHVWLRSLSG